jgi:hypothetical protein
MSGGSHSACLQTSHPAGCVGFMKYFLPCATHKAHLFTFYDRQNLVSKLSGVRKVRSRDSVYHALNLDFGCTFSV